MKCKADTDIKDCCNQEKCCTECGYEDCHEGCKELERYGCCENCPHSDIELKSCPFCGSRAKLIIHTDTIGVYCTKCLTQMSSRYGKKDIDIDKRIVDAWNLRT